MSARAEALYHLPAARGEEQRRYMEELEAAGICVFCPEHFAAYHREPVELSGEHWYVTRNDYPYQGALAHYLIVPHRAQLQPPAVATVERSGDMRYNGGSVAHLHVHFVALDDAPERTVRFRVSREAPSSSAPS
jgi:ATP adenylyltransferase